MGFGDIIKGIGEALNPIDGVVQGVKDVIGTFKMDPIEKAKLDMAVMQLEIQAAQAKREAQHKIEQLYVQDVASLREQVKAEISSEDPWVRRARPAFFWMIYAILGFNYILLPTAALFGSGLKPIEYPYEMWVVFGSAYLGYAYMRSRFDKQGLRSPILK